MRAIFLSLTVLLAISARSASAWMQEMDDDIFQRMVNYYNNDPNTAMERMLFNNMKPDVSIDVVIDLNYCPNNDDTDKRVAASPVNNIFFRAPVDGPPVDVSSTYYDMIGVFIDWLSLDVRASQIYTVIIDNGQKFYIRGRPINQTMPLTDMTTLADSTTHSRALWPHMTGADSEAWHNTGFFNNNLGHLTKLALYARDNGLPIVLKDRKELNTGFTVVITDGSAKTPAYLYSSEPSKTMIIDIGGRRYAQNLAFSDFLQYANVLTLDAPQVLPLVANNARYIACLAVSSM